MRARLSLAGARRRPGELLFTLLLADPQEKCDNETKRGSNGRPGDSEIPMGGDAYVVNQSE